MKTDR